MSYKNFTFKTGRVYDYEQEIDVKVIDTTVYFRDEQRLCFGYYDATNVIEWFEEDTEEAKFMWSRKGSREDYLKDEVLRNYDNNTFKTLNQKQRKEIFG